MASERGSRHCRACEDAAEDRTDTERQLDALRQRMIGALDERISKSEHYGWLGRNGR
jgi:hypothetical protein